MKDNSAEPPKKIDLGCGEEKATGFYGVDAIQTESVDKVLDLDSEEWGLPLNHFEVIRAKDVFEHLENPVNFLENIHSIGCDGAEVRIKTSHQSSQNWTDPTHKRLAGLKTIENYFTESGQFSFYSDANFTVESVEILFEKRKVFFFNYLVEPVVNTSYFTKYVYERSFLSRLFPARDIRFKLRVVK